MGNKKSFYNVEIKTLENGDVLLFNSLTTAFGLMDKKTQDIYYSLDSVNTGSVPDEEDLRNLETLKTNGFVIDSELNEGKMLNLLGRSARYDLKSLDLTVAPTLDCNMACPYCYEDKSSKKIMSEKTGMQLIEFIKRKISTDRINKLTVTWYGGEPLLELETIQKLSGEIINLCNENRIKYQAGIVTNGALLNRETAAVLRENCAVYVAQVTIDGLKDKHNRRRSLNNNDDSFKLITDNIVAVKDIINIGIRVNLDRSNIEEAEKLIDYFIDEKKWGDRVSIHFAPVEDKDGTCSMTQGSCYTMKEFGEIDSKLLRRIYSKGNYRLIDSKYPKFKPACCGAIAANSFVVGPDGYLYKCWNVIGNKKRVVGTLAEGEILNSENIDWMTLDLPEDCTSCNLLPICQGGCPYNRIVNGNQPSCCHETVSFKENLNITYEEFIKNRA